MTARRAVAVRPATQLSGRARRELGLAPCAGGRPSDGGGAHAQACGDGVARAIRTLREAMTPKPGDRVVPLSPQMVGLRFTAAAAAAGPQPARRGLTGTGGCGRSNGSSSELVTTVRLA